MSNSKATALVRVSADIRKKLNKLKNKHNFSSLAKALEFLIEKEADRRAEIKISKLEEKLKKINSIINNFNSSEAARAAQWILLLEEIKPGLSQRISSLLIHEKYRKLVEAIREDLEKR